MEPNCISEDPTPQPQYPLNSQIQQTSFNIANFTHNGGNSFSFRFVLIDASSRILRLPACPVIRVPVYFKATEAV